MDNALYYGDNLDILRRYIPDESVDLVYLDPFCGCGTTIAAEQLARRLDSRAVHC